MRGFFGIGVEGGDKIGNLGNLVRTAHGFGASFVFAVGSSHFSGKSYADTSRAFHNVPFYRLDTIEELMLPKLCKLVAVELTDDAVDLPSFAHPRQAAYILGPEQGSLSGEVLERCDHVVKIPTSFCLNQATAGAIVMYDRVRMLGRWPKRPVSFMGEPEPLPEHVHGGPVSRTKNKNGGN